jgi:hypothetical protein
MTDEINEKLPFGGAPKHKHSGSASGSNALVMRYTHDCDICIPLGQYQKNDLYYCNQHGMPTVIARFGNGGAEYTSGMGFAEIDPRLSIALLMAKAMGLVDA